MKWSGSQCLILSIFLTFQKPSLYQEINNHLASIVSPLAQYFIKRRDHGLPVYLLALGGRCHRGGIHVQHIL